MEGMMIRASLAVVAAVVVGACASMGGQAAPAGRHAYGVYHFRETVPNSSPAMVVEGDVILTPDTISVTTTSGPCSYDARLQMVRSIRYLCGAVTFTFDRAEPLRRNSFSARTTEMYNERYCAQTTMINGVDRCVRYETRRAAREVTRFGTLRITATP